MNETAQIIRTILVDDEPLAREGLAILLSDFKNILIVGDYSNGKQALEAITEMDIDLVFLDIQMPEMTGLEVVAEIGKLGKKPGIVFITAFNEYAVKAFEFHAIDYLLKPIDREMVTRAVQRVSERLSEHKNENFGDLQHLIRSIFDAKHNANPFGTHKKIPIKADGKVFFLNTKDIPLIEANGDYINVYHEEKCYLVHDRLKNMEEVLEHSGFMRIHRSYLINTSCIRSIENDPFGEFIFSFENSPKRVRSSRGYSRNVQDFLEDFTTR